MAVIVALAGGATTAALRGARDLLAGALSVRRAPADMLTGHLAEGLISMLGRRTVSTQLRCAVAVYRVVGGKGVAERLALVTDLRSVSGRA